MSAAHADLPHLTSENTRLPANSLWGKFPLIGIGVGVVCLILAFVLGTTEAHGGHPESHQQFYVSYLTSYMFWLSLALGGLFFVLIQHGTRAGWSIVIRRLAENWMAVLPVMGLLVAPVFIGQHDLFHWSHDPALLKDDFILQKKISYFDNGFYLARTVIVVLVWAGLSFLLRRWSTAQDQTGDVALTHKMRWIAPLGFVFFALSTTIAAIDWMMSLDPHWYSTIFGVYYFAGTVMASGAALTLSAMAVQKSGVLKDAITTEHYHDLGKWTFAFVVFWAYIAVSQFLLIWYANIPEETIWYGHRLEHGWEYLTMFLPIAHFFIPFFFLMSRHIKRRKVLLAVGAAWVLFAHYVDMFWLIQPAVHKDHFSIHIADLLTLVGLGGIAIGLFAFYTAKSPTAPVKDPRLTESLRFENF
ncbi:MAG TPA: hypothetical protein PK095_02120 [Myxococcota bacterium]|nr:hypothetical protein [Myxococcota bacterium]